MNKLLASITNLLNLKNVKHFLVSKEVEWEIQIPHYETERPWFVISVNQEGAKISPVSKGANWSTKITEENHKFILSFYLVYCDHLS